MCGCRQLPGRVLQLGGAGLHHGAAPLLLFLLLPDLGPPDEAQLRLPPGAGILRRGLATPRDTVQVGHNTQDDSNVCFIKSVTNLYCVINS